MVTLFNKYFKAIKKRKLDFLHKVIKESRNIEKLQEREMLLLQMRMETKRSILKMEIELKLIEEKGNGQPQIHLEL